MLARRYLKVDVNTGWFYFFRSQMRDITTLTHREYFFAAVQRKTCEMQMKESKR